MLQLAQMDYADKIKMYYWFMVLKTLSCDLVLIFFRSIRYTIGCSIEKNIRSNYNTFHKKNFNCYTDENMNEKRTYHKLLIRAVRVTC